jgi:flavodoxin
MKYLISERQLLEVIKFPKENATQDKNTVMIEKLVRNQLGSSVCDILVYLSNHDENGLNDFYIVLISYNGYYNGKENDIEDMIRNFIPVPILVVMMDNDGGCKD